ncbi:MAG: response regulator [Desulfobacteraceae bacterium]|nr:response regulator [Desulfobacteraceae bacterium]
MNEPISDATILIVDDHTDNLRVLSNILKEQGYGLRALRKGEAVFSSVLQSPPDIILLDIIMPGMGGYEVCEQLKADERTRDIPVIFISALHETDEKIRAFSVGGVDYITKPFQEQEVLKRVHVHLTLRYIRTSLEQEIMERERAEKKRREYQHRLQQARKAESLGRMAGAVAHHFNNLLFVVSGNLELVRDDLSPQSQAVEFLYNAEEAVQKAIDLGRLMLTYVGQGEEERTVSMCDLTKIVSKIAPLAETSLPDNVHLQLELMPGLPQVKISPDSARRIMMNLVENAWESMEGKTGIVRSVTGKTSCSRSCLEQAAWVGKCEPGEYVYLEVADNGCGMNAETIERMFDPFFTTKFTGRGLGLASVAGIVRSGGGAIAVSSKSGAGTEVRVLFPIAYESE